MTQMPHDFTNGPPSPFVDTDAVARTKRGVLAARIGSIYLAVAATANSIADATWTDMWRRSLRDDEFGHASGWQELLDTIAVTRGASPVMAMTETDLFAMTASFNLWWLLHPLLAGACVVLVLKGSRWGARAILAVHAVIATFALVSLFSRPDVNTPWTRWWIYARDHSDGIDPQMRLVHLEWWGAGLATVAVIAVLVGVRHLPARPRRERVAAEASDTSRELERRDAAFEAWAENYAEKHDGPAPSDGIALPESLEGGPRDLDPRDP